MFDSMYLQLIDLSSYSELLCYFQVLGLYKWPCDKALDYCLGICSNPITTS